jgi:hypothetical protein
MSGLINVIKSLVGGIFGFIGGLFGGKKGNGYFMELDEAKVAPAKTITPAPAASTAPVAEQPMTVAKEDVAQAPTPAKAATRKEKLAALAASTDPSAAPTAAPAPVAAATPKAAPTAVANPIAEANFATKYLIPANNGTRRRPGANMSSYLDMARKMNGAS